VPRRSIGTKTASASLQYHEIRNASSIPVYHMNGTFSLSKICEDSNGVNFEIALTLLNGHIHNESRGLFSRANARDCSHALASNL
jgi:hypothetical protein